MSLQRTRANKFVGMSVATCLLFSALIFCFSAVTPALAAGVITATPSDSDNFVIRVVPTKSDDASQAVIKKHLGEEDYISNYSFAVLGKFPDQQHMLNKASISTIENAVQNKIRLSIEKVDYLTYNNERWKWTPIEEQTNPAESTNKAMDIIHAAGYKSAVSPARTILLQELYGVDWNKVDYLNMQLQRVVGGPQFSTIAQQVSSVARQQNPDIIITAQVNPKFNTIPEIVNAVKSIRDHIDGVSIIWNMDDATTLDNLLIGLSIFRTDDGGGGGGIDNPPTFTALNRSPMSPTSSQVVGFTASATDDLGISSIEIFVDGLSLGSCSISDAHAGSCIKLGGPYAASTTHSYNARVKDTSGNTATSSTGNFAVQSSGTQTKELFLDALFRPGTTEETNQETFNIYSKYLDSQDQICTHEPRNNWVLVKQLATSTGAEICLGYSTFLDSQTTVKTKWPGTEWVVFDMEGDEYADPAVAQREMKEAATRVHNAGLKLLANAGSPVNQNEGNIREFAKISDALLIQVMGMQDSPNQFRSFVTESVGWARSANPNIPIIIEPSVSFRGTNDQYREPEYVYELLKPVLKIPDGIRFFYGTPEEDTSMAHLPRLKEMLALLYE